MGSMPFRQSRSSALMLDDFSPTTAVVSAKADFTLGRCHGSSGIADSRKIVIKSVLEPHPINDHDSPAPVTGICILRPVFAAASYPVETILK
jgi:hypothetical protein